MGIVDEDVERVKDATDLVALVGEHVALKRVGRRLQGLCPFHAEKTASFSVNPEMGLFHCFGCQASGDAITFVREIEHLDFVGAVERLAARTGITLRYDDRDRGPDRERKSRLTDAIAEAVAFYHRRLVDAPDAGPARAYLRGRGFDGDVARRFSIGWAPDGWDELARHLQDRKFSRDDVVGAGLAFVNWRQRLQDQFRSRIMFPIFDVAGDPVAFGGRALGDQGPKYVNSPETPIYRKSRVLYGLNWAKGEIAAAGGEVVVCEGYTDVIACFLAGLPRAVATCGTALSDGHVRLLRRFAERFVLAYDADAAGQAAAERFYAWEAEHDLSLFVATLPAGRDPGDVGREDPAALRDAVENAVPFLRFRVDRLLAGADRATPEARARAAEGVVALLAEHPNDLVRDQYVMELAEELRIGVDRLREAVGRSRERGRPTADGRARVPEERPAVELVGLPRRELELLRLGVHVPDLLPPWVHGGLLQEPSAREAFAALRAGEGLTSALSGVGDEARRLLERVAVEEFEVSDDGERYALAVAATVAEAAGEERVQAMARAVDDRASEGKRRLDELTRARSEGEWIAVREAAEHLVAWFDGASEE